MIPAPRRQIYFMDGTWQRRDQRHPTNVAKLAQFVDITPEQLVHYDAGVGTGWPRIAGGMFGIGLVTNILEAYEWLRARYVPGDWIVLVAYSRGSHGVRNVADLLGSVGFDDPDMPVRDVWRRYRAMYRTTRPIPVRAVGVFDTVGAHGVPSALAGGRWRPSSPIATSASMSSMVSMPSRSMNSAAPLRPVSGPTRKSMAAYNRHGSRVGIPT